MTLPNKDLATLRRKLTSAIRSKDTGKILRTCDDAVKVFEEKGYPDDWKRWERAKQDAVFAHILRVFKA